MFEVGSKEISSKEAVVSALPRSYERPKRCARVIYSLFVGGRVSVRGNMCASICRSECMCKNVCMYMRLCLRSPVYKRKRDLAYEQKRPTVRAKRPTIRAKETYYKSKRDRL